MSSIRACPSHCPPRCVHSCKWKYRFSLHAQLPRGAQGLSACTVALHACTPTTVEVGELQHPLHATPSCAPWPPPQSARPADPPRSWPPLPAPPTTHPQPPYNARLIHPASIPFTRSRAAWQPPQSARPADSPRSWPPLPAHLATRPQPPYEAKLMYPSSLNSFHPQPRTMAASAECAACSAASVAASASTPRDPSSASPAPASSLLPGEPPLVRKDCARCAPGGAELCACVCVCVNVCMYVYVCVCYVCIRYVCAFPYLWER